MRNVTREELIEALKEHIKLAKKLKGELVVLNKIDDEADEFIIENINDFDLIKTKSGDLLEITIYVDDDDEFFEEYTIIENKSDNKKSGANHFQQFMKKGKGR